MFYNHHSQCFDHQKPRFMVVSIIIYSGFWQSIDVDLVVIYIHVFSLRSIRVGTTLSIYVFQLMACSVRLVWTCRVGGSDLDHIEASDSDGSETQISILGILLTSSNTLGCAQTWQFKHPGCYSGFQWGKNTSMFIAMFDYLRVNPNWHLCMLLLCPAIPAIFLYWSHGAMISVDKHIRLVFTLTCLKTEDFLWCYLQVFFKYKLFAIGL